MSVRVGDEIVAGGQGDMYTKAQVDALIASAIAQTTEKPGMIKPFAGTTVPTGYLLCDGSAVSRTTYANLFAAIGTTYGSGDGSTTFNLPSFFAGDSIIYGTPGLRENGGVPNITGDFGFMGAGSSRGWFSDISGVFSYGIAKPASRRLIGEATATTDTTLLHFDANRISSIYNSSQKVYASGVKLRFYIKY